MLKDMRLFVISLLFVSLQVAASDHKGLCNTILSFMKNDNAGIPSIASERRAAERRYAAAERRTDKRFALEFSIAECLADQRSAMLVEHRAAQRRSVTMPSKQKNSSESAYIKSESSVDNLNALFQRIFDKKKQSFDSRKAGKAVSSKVVAARNYNGSRAGRRNFVATLSTIAELE